MNMHTDNKYRMATVLFYEAKYDNALRAINQYIETKPRSSMAFNNRALIHLNMGNSSLAKQDIKFALELNHLNYIAYFNLFSVYSREKDLEAALLALQGALSCLYLIKGRLTKDRQVLTKAIELSVNNIDALLLLVLVEISDGNYQKALTLVKAAKSLNENLLILDKLTVLIKGLQVKYSEEKEEALFDYLIEITPQYSKLSGIMLVSQAKASREHIQVIRERVVQFNKLYSQINVKAGGASYLVAKAPDQPQEGQQSMDKALNKELKKKEQVVARY